MAAVLECRNACTEGHANQALQGHNIPVAHRLALMEPFPQKGKSLLCRKT